MNQHAGEQHVLIEGGDLSGLTNEAGGHRIQRVPPTERKGRVHTSTVTVAIVDPKTIATVIRESDLEIEWYSGTGAGGQYRNKHQNSCRITHRPTGITAKSECRSRANSLAEAAAAIQQRVDHTLQNRHNSAVALDRRAQVGTGMRGDKIRTYRFQDDVTQDHVTGHRASTRRVLQGNFDLLWP